jgi:cobalamin biosynthesis protein CobT
VKHNLAIGGAVSYDEDQQAKVVVFNPNDRGQQIWYDKDNSQIVNYFGRCLSVTGEKDTKLIWRHCGEVKDKRQHFRLIRDGKYRTLLQMKDDDINMDENEVEQQPAAKKEDKKSADEESSDEDDALLKVHEDENDNEDEEKDEQKDEAEESSSDSN